MGISNDMPQNDPTERAKADVEKAAREALTKAGLEEGDPDLSPSVLAPILADRVWRALDANPPKKARRKKGEPEQTDDGPMNLKSVRAEAEAHLETVLRERITLMARIIVEDRGIEDCGVSPTLETLIDNIVDEVMPGLRKKDDEKNAEEEEKLPDSD